MKCVIKSCVVYLLFQVIVTNPDGTPAPGEYISVSATNYNSRYDWKKNFTSDENGVVHYVLTDISPENGNLNIRVSIFQYSSRKHAYKILTPLNPTFI